jgi:hypothetical protein
MTQNLPAKTYREFRYEKMSSLCVRRVPRGEGGDCEDFALYTAASFVLGLGTLSWFSRTAREGVGHAVCLSYEKGIISDGYTYFELG